MLIAGRGVLNVLIAGRGVLIAGRGVLIAGRGVLTLLVLHCRQCWECLAEAYLARGSHSSALRAFSKVVEVRDCIDLYMY